MRKQTLTYGTMDANQMVMEAAELLAHEIKKAGVSLAFELEPRPPQVVADAVLVQQVIINLIMNALEAMASSGDHPRRLTLGTTAGVDGTCTVSVGDTGPGVPAALAEQIFNSFVTSKPQGMGLGLVLSRSIIEQHEGRIWHERGAAGGALFRFTLPAGPSGKKGAPP
jgi:two-component system sensor kinase FixL